MGWCWWSTEVGQGWLPMDLGMAMTRGPAEYRLQWNKEWMGDNHGISFQEIRMWKEMSTFGYLLINPIIYIDINSDFFLVMQLPFYIHRPSHTQFVLTIIRSKQFGIIKACLCAGYVSVALPVLLHAQSFSSAWLCNPMDHSPPGSSFHGIFQEIILECVAISSFRGSCQPRDWTCISCVYYIGWWHYLDLH